MTTPKPQPRTAAQRMAALRNRKAIVAAVREQALLEIAANSSDPLAKVIATAALRPIKGE